MEILKPPSGIVHLISSIARAPREGHVSVHPDSVPPADRSSSGNHPFSDSVFKRDVSPNIPIIFQIDFFKPEFFINVKSWFQFSVGDEKQPLCAMIQSPIHRGFEHSTSRTFMQEIFIRREFADFPRHPVHRLCHTGCQSLINFHRKKDHRSIAQFFINFLKGFFIVFFQRSEMGDYPICIKNR